ncbi:MAG: hypothetical protein WDO14_15410 [Bacteroidota bacterium]
MDELKDDILGFEKFRIDEQLFSLLNQLLGGYARLTFRKEKDDKYRVLFENRFRELGKLKHDVGRFSYPEKLRNIEKFQHELNDVLSKEKAL